MFKSKYFYLHNLIKLCLNIQFFTIKVLFLCRNHWVLIVVDLKRGESNEFNSVVVTPFKKRRWLNRTMF